MNEHERASRMLAIGTKTRWGQIRAVGILGGERYYWMIDRHKAVSMMPACAVEPTVRAIAEKLEGK